MKDRELFVLRAPAAGVIYYGRNTDRDWTEVAARGRQLRSGGAVSPNEVLLTIVEDQPLVVRCSVPEKDLFQLRPGDVKVMPVACPREVVAGKLKEITGVPVAPGQFVARVQLDSVPDSLNLAAGMKCKVKATAFEDKNALWVPIAALKEDEWDGQKYVVASEEDGGPKRKNVKVGRSNGSRVEILEGLSEGDQVWLNGRRPRANEESAQN